MKCEDCDATDTYKSAYDDRNFWDNVVPGFKCKECGKSTKDLGLEVQPMGTRYDEGEEV
jgi:transposase-like protein